MMVSLVDKLGVFEELGPVLYETGATGQDKEIKTVETNKLLNKSV